MKVIIIIINIILRFTNVTCGFDSPTTGPEPTDRWSSPADLQPEYALLCPVDGVWCAAGRR